MSDIRIFIADDHAILREGLISILQRDTKHVIVGEAGDGRRALEQIERIKPDIAILDISMPLMTGIEVARQIRKYHPEIKVIMLSQHDNEEYIRQVVKYGIHAYILKENASQDLLRAVEEVMKDNVYLSPGITKKIMAGYSDDTTGNDLPSTGALSDRLSPRELEILKLITEGKTNKEIASLLFISDKTVNVHRARIMKKLEVRKTADLIKYALKNRLVE